MNRALRVLTAIVAIMVPAIAIASPARAAPVNGSQTSNDQGSQGDDQGNDQGNDHGNGEGDHSDYPPRSPMLTTPTPTTTPGAHLTLIATGFAPGATIRFTISGSGDQNGHDGDRSRRGGNHSSSLGSKVADANGSATLQTSAPRSTGRYKVTASSGHDRASLSLLVKGQRHNDCGDDSHPPSHNSSDRGGNGNGNDCRDDSHSVWSNS